MLKDIKEIEKSTRQWRHNERDSVSNNQPHDFYSTINQAQIKENIEMYFLV